MKKLEELERESEKSIFCGGTVASSCLIEVLEFRDAYLTRIDNVAEKWRASLIEHNAQTKKIVEYDVRTGKEK